MDEKNITWQELFTRDFKDGDDVIVVTEDDKFDWGMLRIGEKSIKLVHGADRKGKEMGHEYSYFQLTFMCHQGFPIRKLTGADGSQSVLKEDASDVQEAIRYELDEINSQKDTQRHEKIQGLDDFESVINFILSDSKKNISEKIEKLRPKKVLPTKFGFNDPYFVEASEVKLFNCGNSGLKFNYSSFIETMVLVSSDNAKAHLWDLASVFFAE
jgi:hypothetical protein